MSDEHTKFRGRLAVKEDALAKLKIKIAVRRDSLRDNLDPFVDVAELPGEIIASEAVELGELLIQLRCLLDEIRAIKKALGR